MSTARELRDLVPYWPTHAALVERAAAEIDELRAVIHEDILPITYAFKTAEGKQLHAKLLALLETSK